MVSVDVREVIVAGWWRGWELCSELGSFGSTVFGAVNLLGVMPKL
jgi:hypothetical protein